MWFSFCVAFYKENTFVTNKYMRNGCVIVYKGINSLTKQIFV